MNGTAVAIVNSFVGKKHRHSGDRVTLAIDLNNGLLPQKLVFKLRLPMPCEIWLEPVHMQDQSVAAAADGWPFVTSDDEVDRSQDCPINSLSWEPESPKTNSSSAPSSVSVINSTTA